LPAFLVLVARCPAIVPPHAKTVPLVDNHQE